MHFLTIATSVLATAASVTSSAIGRRDVGTLIADMQTLSDRSGDLSVALSAFTGTPASAEAVELSLSSVMSFFPEVLASTNTIVPMLDPHQSRQVVVAVQAQAGIVHDFLNKMIAKKNLIIAAHQESAVVAAMGQFQDFAKKFFGMIIPRLHGIDANIMAITGAGLKSEMERVTSVYM